MINRWKRPLGNNLTPPITYVVDSVAEGQGRKSRSRDEISLLVRVGGEIEGAVALASGRRGDEGEEEKDGEERKTKN